MHNKKDQQISSKKIYNKWNRNIKTIQIGNNRANN